MIAVKQMRGTMRLAKIGLYLYVAQAATGAAIGVAIAIAQQIAG